MMKRVFAPVTCLLFLCVVALAIAGVGIDSVGAQAKKMAAPPPPAPPEMIAVTTVRVKPEMLNEWLDLQRNEVLPAIKKGGLKSREAWTTGVFGESFEYVFVAPITNFAQYDSDSPQVKALGAEGSRALVAKQRRMVASSHTTAYLMRPDLSFQGNMTGAPKFSIVTFVKVTSGRNLAFESLVKTVVTPTMKRAGVSGYFVGQAIYGGDANGYVTLVPIENFAELDKGSPFNRADGPQGVNRFLPKTLGIVISAERVISRYVADLSFANP